MHIKKKNCPTNRTIRCRWDLIYRSSANERDTRAIYEIILSMRIHFDVKFLKIISDGHFSLMVTVQPVVFILISVSICGKYSWEKLFEGILLSNVFARRVTHISRSNFLYEKILRTTRGGRESDRKRQVPFSIALHFFFFVIFLLHLFPSSLSFSFLFDAVIRISSVNASMHRRHLFPPLSETHRTKIIEMKRR